MSQPRVKLAILPLVAALAACGGTTTAPRPGPGEAGTCYSREDGVCLEYGGAISADLWKQLGDACESPMLWTIAECTQAGRIGICSVLSGRLGVATKMHFYAPNTVQTATMACDYMKGTYSKE